MHYACARVAKGTPKVDVREPVKACRCAAPDGFSRLAAHERQAFAHAPESFVNGNREEWRVRHYWAHSDSGTWREL